MNFDKCVKCEWVHGSFDKRAKNFNFAMDLHTSSPPDLVRISSLFRVSILDEGVDPDSNPLPRESVKKLVELGIQAEFRNMARI